MKRLTTLLTLALVATFVLAAPAAAARPGSGAGITQAVTGTVGETGQFVGNITVTDFAVQDGQLIASGTITGTLTDTVTGVTATVDDTFTSVINLTQSTGTCEILELVLGPLHLDLLGLVVDLNQVVLEITAVPGAGNLLGNLLCAVAGLLDGPTVGSALNNIARLLDQILSLLG